MKCLLIRQPYASLISDGYKRYEFRNVTCNYRGAIFLAASKGNSLYTSDFTLNNFSNQLPKGSILAIANITDSIKVNSSFIKKKFTGIKATELESKIIYTSSEPLGEPLFDIISAISDPNWSCYAWKLSNVVKLSKSIEYSAKPYSSWLNLDEKSDEYSDLLDIYLSYCQG